MSLLSDLNFLATVLAFGTVSFAASNFGTKLGRVTGFNNSSGFEYISSLDKEKSDELYEAIVKTSGSNSPYYWAKNKDDLRNWCKKNERKARKWKVTSEYCLIKNNVKHQLLKKGKTLVEENPTATVNGCNDELWNSYDDGTGTSKGYLFAMTKCVKQDASSEVSIQQTTPNGTQGAQTSAGGDGTSSTSG